MTEPVRLVELYRTVAEDVETVGRRALVEDHLASFVNGGDAAFAELVQLVGSQIGHNAVLPNSAVFTIDPPHENPLFLSLAGIAPGSSAVSACL